MLTPSFTYNGITFKTLVRKSGYKAVFVNGDQVGIRDTITSLPGVDGVERYKSFYRDRLIEIRGFVLGDGQEDLYDNINALDAAFNIHNLEASVAGTDGFLPLTFTEPGQGEAVYYCKPIKQTLVVQEKVTGFVRGFSVLLEAKDPVKYQSEDTIFTLQPSTEITASYFPMSFPVAFGSSSASASITANNTGGVKVRPTQIKIYASCIAPVVGNSTTGKSIGFTSDVQLSEGEYIIIDPNLGTAYKYSGGMSENIIGYLTSGSEFFDLLPGNNTLTYNATSMSDSKVEITIKLSI